MWRKDFLLHRTWKLWSLENSADSFFLFLTSFTSLSALHLILYWSLSLSFCTVFDSISSNIDEVFSINSSANMLLPVDFNIHHKDWLIYSGGTDTSGELCYNFSISNDLIQMVNFPTRIHDCDSQSCFFGLIYFFQCQYFFYNGFPSVKKFWLCCCLSFHWLPTIFLTGCPVSSNCLWLFSCWLGWLRSFERCSMRGYL